VKIGVAAENRPLEKRVALQPEELKSIAKNHQVFVEAGAGLSLGIIDAEYIAVGCKIAPREKVYAADLVIRIKEPNHSEVKLMKPHSILMSMMHLRCEPELERNLVKQKIIAIPLENIKNSIGKRIVEAVMDCGRIGVDFGFKLWGKDPAKAKVKIMGYGNISRGAVQEAARKLAHVEVLNRKHFEEMEKHLPGTDILVDAVNRPFRRAVKHELPFVTREMLKLLKPGSVIIDLVSNPVGHAPVETMKPTTLKDPYFVLDGIYHTSLWGWPAMDPEKISKRYSMQIAPLVKVIAARGLDGAPPPIKNAVIRLDRGEKVV